MPGADAPEETHACLGCNSPCCRLLVELTTYDILRIMIHEGIDSTEFAEAIIADVQDTYAFKAGGGLMKLVLKWEGRGCIFLDESRDLMCKVDNSKPSICLSYPFKLEAGRVSASQTALCPRKSILLQRYGQGYADVLKDYEYEWELYGEFVDDWNLNAKGNESIQEFLEFARRQTDLESSYLGAIYRRCARSINRLLRKRI